MSGLNASELMPGPGKENVEYVVKVLEVPVTREVEVEKIVYQEVLCRVCVCVCVCVCVSQQVGL